MFKSVLDHTTIVSLYLNTILGYPVIIYLLKPSFYGIHDPPIPSTTLQSGNPQVIIPGSNINSDLTISFGTIKTRLKNLLLNSQKLENRIDWINSNSLGH